MSRGVFASFAEAEASAPAGAKVGFDLPEVVHAFEHRCHELVAIDYPCIFWLRQIVEPGRRVFDIGGNLGVHFHAYRQRIPILEDVVWQVCEVPVVAHAGAKSAQDSGTTQLRFTTDITEADGADVILAAGSLQYIERPRLPELLQSLAERPRRLVINKLPLYEGEPYVTLQNAGLHYVAQRVENRAQFLRELAELGYSLIDEWRDDTRACRPPMHPECAVPSFTGLYLTRSAGL